MRPDFELTEVNAAAVAEICRRLDGIPLAIELAAARVKLLTLQTLGERLGHRFELLTGGRADQPLRQQTLREAIDWSYNLLDETEQDVLARLGVFVGGSSLEAAETVAGEPLALEFGEMLDALAALVDKGLVRQSEAADGEPRFRMLETIREYALEQLEERGDARRVRELHAAHFLRLAETAEPELTRPNQAAWLERLDEENDNIRAALAWCVEADEVELALRFGSALVRFWSIRGLMTEGRRWLREALADAHDAPLSTLADAEFALGYAALGQGDYADAESRFRRSLELAAGDPQAEAAARAQLAWLAMTSGSADDEAAALAEASLRGARELDDKRRPRERSACSPSSLCGEETPPGAAAARGEPRAAPRSRRQAADRELAAQPGARAIGGGRLRACPSALRRRSRPRARDRRHLERVGRARGARPSGASAGGAGGGGGLLPRRARAGLRPGRQACRRRLPARAGRRARRRGVGG